ncbi:MAG: signal peptidase I [Candidatus Fermentibacter sp.]|nr:signal peptidase I [Candidatus Fermentibacter sp.]
MTRAKVLDWFLQLALALVVFFGFLRPYVVESFRIPSPSMEGTLLVGDHILVLKAARGQRIPWTDRVEPPLHAFRGSGNGLLMPALGSIEEGDILVFRCPADMRKDFIKRVVALEGDTVSVRDDKLFVNGRPSSYPVQYQDAFSPNPLDILWPRCVPSLRGIVPDLAFDELARGATRDWESYVVPPGHVFMMGDNRDNSSDSRVWGPLDADLVKGEAMCIYWSWAPGRGLPLFGRIARLVR